MDRTAFRGTSARKIEQLPAAKEEFRMVREIGRQAAGMLSQRGKRSSLLTEVDWARPAGCRQPRPMLPECHNF